jgi:hypothetical protein
VELAGELDALALAARQRIEWLAEREIANPDIACGAQLLDDRARLLRLRARAVLEEGEGFADRQREEVADVLAAQRAPRP